MDRALEVGTVLVSTWGYDQTNVDFYRVTKVTAKSVWLVPVAQKFVESTGWLSEMVTVDPDLTATGKEFRRKRRGNSVKLTSYSWASPWSGRNVNQTHYH